ncbi:uncharacterized protein KY384_007757 [Bacidia gigantensis]|uniref:uncharacterized protein n=1 Tax=Bacidia gigantensis TaxID=2732470 RepID=UPI001D051FB1|nr:uncharacterized protein KY384_007757 [Bacidia gigantensis]KAG8527604.1 hypothetical protein KY384_007757 [Bacidia gigantensis]
MSENRKRSSSARDGEEQPKGSVSSGKGDREGQVQPSASVSIEVNIGNDYNDGNRRDEETNRRDGRSSPSQDRPNEKQYSPLNYSPANGQHCRIRVGEVTHRAHRTHKTSLLMWQRVMPLGAHVLVVVIAMEQAVPMDATAVQHTITESQNRPRCICLTYTEEHLSTRAFAVRMSTAGIRLRKEIAQGHQFQNLRSLAMELQAWSYLAKTVGLQSHHCGGAMKEVEQFAMRVRSRDLGVDFTGYQLQKGVEKASPSLPQKSQQQLPPVSSLDPEPWTRTAESEVGSRLSPMTISRKRSHSNTEQSSPSTLAGSTLAGSMDDPNRPRLSSISQILNTPQHVSAVEDYAIDPHLSHLPPHLQQHRHPTLIPPPSQQPANGSQNQAQLQRHDSSSQGFGSPTRGPDYADKMARLKREADQMRELLISKEKEIQELERGRELQG